MNADCADQEFVLPGPELTWTKLIDAARPEAPEGPLDDDRAQVAGYSVMVLMARLE
jgi:hypothetical protein